MDALGRRGEVHKFGGCVRSKIYVTYEGRSEPGRNATGPKCGMVQFQFGGSVWSKR